MMFEIHAVSIQSYFWNQVHENAWTRNDSKLFLMDLHKIFRNFHPSKMHNCHRSFYRVEVTRVRWGIIKISRTCQSSAKGHTLPCKRECMDT